MKKQRSGAVKRRRSSLFPAEDPTERYPLGLKRCQIEHPAEHRAHCQVGYVGQAVALKHLEQQPDHQSHQQGGQPRGHAPGKDPGL